MWTLAPIELLAVLVTALIAGFGWSIGAKIAGRIFP